MEALTQIKGEEKQIQHKSDAWRRPTVTNSRITGPLFTSLGGDGGFSQIRTDVPETRRGPSCDVVCRYLFRPIRRSESAFTEGNVSPSLLPNEGSGMKRSLFLPLICCPSSPPTLPLLFPSTGPPGNEWRRSPTMTLQLMKCQMCVRRLRRVDLRARFPVFTRTAPIFPG